MENINIASFDFDDSKIINRLEEIKKNIDELNESRFLEQKRLSELNKEYNSITKEMEKLTKSGQGQSKEFEDLANKQGQYLKNIVQSKSAISEISNETRQLNTESKQLNQNLENQIKQQDLINKGYDVENKSINQLREDRKLLIKLRNDEVSVMGEQSEVAKRLNKIIEDSTNQEKKLVAETEKRFYQIGDYANQLSDQFQNLRGSVSSIASGDLKNGVNGLTASLGNMGRVLNAIPLLAIVGVVYSIAQYMWSFNQSIKENLKLIEQVTGATEEMADKIRASIQSIADTYNRDFKETLLEVKNLAKDFGISYDEAFKIYNKGLAEGGYLNQEFGDSIREYGVLFSQAGYSAKEFINLINTGYDLGIYTDKLPDAIKEAQISLNESTKATRDALINAFGASFTDSVLKRVRTGEISVKTALEEISKEAETANLNQQQWAQLTADVFRGAGEDAGGAKLIFDAIYTSIENLNKPLEGTAKAQEDLRISYEELEKAKNNFFKSDSLLEFQNNLKKLWNYFLIDIIGGFEEFVLIWVNGTQQIIGGIKTLNQYLVGVKYAIKDISFDNLRKSWQNFIKAVKDFNWQEVYDDKSNGTSGNAQLKKQIEANKKQLEGYRKYMEEWDKKGGKSQYKPKTTSYTKTSDQLAEEQATAKASKKIADDILKMKLKAIEENKKALADAQKLEEKYLEDYAKLTYDYAQDELTNQIKNNGEKIKNAKVLTDTLVELKRQQIQEEQKLEQQKIDKERAENDRKAQYANEQASTAIEALKVSEERKNQLRLEADNVLKAQLNLNEQAFNQKTLENQNATNLALDQLELDYQQNKQAIEQQRRDFEFQQNILSLENQGATEREIRLSQLNEQYNQELARYAQLKKEGIITQQQYDQASLNLTENKAKQEQEIERIVNQQKLSVIGDTLGSVATLLGENTKAGKIAGSASALINTYQGVTEVWKTPSTLPEPFATIAKVGSTATVVASGLNALKQINKVSTNSVNNASGANASGGTSTNTYKSIYAGGSVGLEGLSISGYNQQQTFGTTNDTSIIADAVREGARQGASEGSSEGLIGLSTNRQILNDAKY